MKAGITVSVTGTATANMVAATDVAPGESGSTVVRSQLTVRLVLAG